MTAQTVPEGVRLCANCEFPDRRLHALRQQQPTGTIVESLVCHYCFVQLTGVTPATARKVTRPER